MVVTMETTFYDDHPTYMRKDKMVERKRQMTLNLRPEMPKLAHSSILTSPDLNMLKLASPELEKLIIENGSYVTTTPTPYEVFSNKCATDEQESYAMGFVTALEKVRQNDQARAHVNHHHHHDVNVSSNSVYTNLDSRVPVSQPHLMPAPTSMHVDYPTTTSSNVPPVTIKDEPQTVPAMIEPILSPINMDRQEHIKLERKRERNRVAASKCRMRKLEKISRLETKVSHLKNENTELYSIVNKLREQVYQLKEEVMEHYNNGCQIMMANNAM